MNRDNKKQITAIIECRMTSTRLPGKVMLTSCGKTMLEHIAERLSTVKAIDTILFATTTNATDDCIAALAEKIGVQCFRGDEEDVLKRVLLAAEACKTDIIVEITGDCPLIDPSIVAQTIDLYMYNECDYASNDLKPSFPLGMDVQVFSRDLLKIADEKGLTAPDREHVSWYFIRNPDQFRLVTLPAPPPLYAPTVRLTLDETDDYLLIDSVFNALYEKYPCFNLYDIMAYLKAHPEVAALNAHIVQRHPSQNEE